MTNFSEVLTSISGDAEKMGKMRELSLQFQQKLQFEKDIDSIEDFFSNKYEILDMIDQIS